MLFNLAFVAPFMIKNFTLVAKAGQCAIGRHRSPSLSGLDMPLVHDSLQNASAIVPAHNGGATPTFAKRPAAAERHSLW